MTQSFLPPNPPSLLFVVVFPLPVIYRDTRFISIVIFISFLFFSLRYVSRYTHVHRDRVIRINLHNVTDTNCEVIKKR